MKAVLMSIKPKWCEKILNGEKTVEVRKTAPKPELPFKVYVYCTKSGMRLYGNKNYYVTDMLKILNGSAIKAFENSSGFYSWNGKVIGEFVCDKVEKYNSSWLDGEDKLKKTTCLDDVEIMDYVEYTGKKFFLWHITAPKLYDKPKDIKEFRSLVLMATCLARNVRNAEKTKAVIYNALIP